MTYNKKVLLIYPSIGLYNYGPKWKICESPAPPLGPLYIAAPLIKAGYQVKFIDLGVDHLNEQQYFDELQSTDFVLITCLTNALENIHQIITDVKCVNDNANVICGGPHGNETNLHIEGSDVTVYGEAELVIAEILGNLTSGKSLSKIPGISFFNNGKLTRIAGYHMIDDLDIIDYPSYELADHKNYNFAYGIKLNKILPIITTRGCPFRCTFCTFQTVKYRERSMDQVIREIQERIKYKIKYLFIIDDNFLLKKKRVEKFANFIIRHKIKVKIIIQGRADFVNVELYRKLRKAGVIVLLIGLESANQDVLNFYKKGTTVQKNKEIVNIANRFGIITYSGFIIGAPIERYTHFEKNKEFLSKVPLDFINVNILRYAYPSPLWFEAYKMGKIRKEDLIVSANETLSNFSYEELMDIRSGMLKSFYTNHARILRILYKVTLNFGFFTMLRLIRSMFNNSLGRTPEEFHGGKILRKQITISSEHKVSDQL